MSIQLKCKRGERILAASLFLGVLSFLCLGVSSCGEEADPERSGPPVEELIEDLEQKMTALIDDGAEDYFPDQVEKNQESLEEAKTLLEEGKEKLARNELKSVTRWTRSAPKRVDRLNKLYETAADAQEAAKKAKRKAQVAKAPSSVPQDYKAALDLQKQGEKALESSSEAKLKSAAKFFNLASSTFEDCIRSAEQAIIARAQVDEAKKAMLGMKAKAKEVGADKSNPTDFRYGEDTEKRAEKAIKEGQYAIAMEAFRSASMTFENLVEDVKRQEAFAKQNEVDSAPKVEEQISLDGDESDLALGDSDDGTDIGDLGSDVDDVDDVDTFLMTHYQKLGEGVTNYDPVTGEITVEYMTGDVLKKDMFFPDPRRPRNRKYVKMRDPLGEPLVFEGNTEGLFLIPVPFTGNFEIEYVMNLLVMDSIGTQGPVFFATKDGKSAWGCSWVQFWSRIAKRVPKKYPVGVKRLARSANYWFDKLHPVTMKITVTDHPKKDNQGVLSVYYHVGEEEGEKPTSQLAFSRKGRTGYIGWEWHRTKFAVREWRVKGTLDKELAMEIIKEKMGLENK